MSYANCIKTPLISNTLKSVQTLYHFLIESEYTSVKGNDVEAQEWLNIHGLPLYQVDFENWVYACEKIREKIVSNDSKIVSNDSKINSLVKIISKATNLSNDVSSIIVKYALVELPTILYKNHEITFKKFLDMLLSDDILNLAKKGGIEDVVLLHHVLDSRQPTLSLSYNDVNYNESNMRYLVDELSKRDDIFVTNLHWNYLTKDMNEYWKVYDPVDSPNNEVIFHLLSGKLISSLSPQEIDKIIKRKQEIPNSKLYMNNVSFFDDKLKGIPTQDGHDPNMYTDWDLWKQQYFIGYLKDTGKRDEDDEELQEFEDDI